MNIKKQSVYLAAAGLLLFPPVSRAQGRAGVVRAPGHQLARPGVPRAPHPAYSGQAASYYGSTPGGGFAGGVSDMMQGMGLGLAPGQSAPPGGVSGMMQGMGLGLPPGATAVPGGLGGSLSGVGYDLQPPYQGPYTGGPGPGNPGYVPDQRAVGSSMPPESAEGGAEPPLLHDKAEGLPQSQDPPDVEADDRKPLCQPTDGPGAQPLMPLSNDGSARAAKSAEPTGSSWADAFAKIPDKVYINEPRTFEQPGFRLPRR